jgi:hypothetical protein
MLDLKRVRKLRALYKGGAALLANDEVMDQVFPRYAGEGEPSYKERKARAFYENMFAQVVNKVVAALGQDPARLDPMPNEDGTIAEGAEVGDYWKQLQKDATPPNDDGEAKTLDQIARAVACEGFVTGRGWILCDMPPAIPASTLKEQEDAGALDAYPVMYRSDQVTDWYESKGVLQWVRCYSCEVLADDPTQERNWTRHTWVIWDRDSYTTYVVELDKQNKNRSGQAVDINTVITPVPELSGTHEFGRVPWVCFDCAADDEPQMHIGDLIESQVCNFFNQSCGDAFHRMRHMFQQLYEFLGPEYPGIGEAIASAQEDPNRARGRRRGPDVVQERGKDDRAEFVSPDMEGADIAKQAIDDAREGIMRVTGQLALSQGTTTVGLGRSADSKKQDRIDEQVVYGAAGKKLIGFLRQVIKLLALGRKDSEVPVAAGYESFDVNDVDDDVMLNTELEAVSVPSATFQIERKFRLACSVLGDNIDQNIREQIRDELTETITQDQFTMVPGATGEYNADDPNADEDTDTDPNADPDKGDDKPPPAKKPGAKKPAPPSKKKPAAKKKPGKGSNANA